MKLSEYFSQARFIHRSAKLLIDLELSSGECRKVGDVVSILMKNADGSYHAEDNEFACQLFEHEFEFVK